LHINTLQRFAGIKNNPTSACKFAIAIKILLRVFAFKFSAVSIASAKVALASSLCPNSICALAISPIPRNQIQLGKIFLVISRDFAKITWVS